MEHTGEGRKSGEAVPGRSQLTMGAVSNAADEEELLSGSSEPAPRSETAEENPRSR